MKSPNKKPRWTTPRENRITGVERKEDGQGVVILKTSQFFVCNISRTLKYGKDIAWEIKFEVRTRWRAAQRHITAVCVFAVAEDKFVVMWWTECSEDAPVQFGGATSGGRWIRWTWCAAWLRACSTTTRWTQDSSMMTGECHEASYRPQRPNEIGIDC
jgi:hypothetical protein